MQVSKKLRKNRQGYALQLSLYLAASRGGILMNTQQQGGTK